MREDHAGPVDDFVPSQTDAEILAEDAAMDEAIEKRFLAGWKSEEDRDEQKYQIDKAGNRLRSLPNETGRAGNASR